MHVDRGAFFLFVTSLAAGGVGGYAASEKDLLPHLDGKRSREAPTTTTSPAAAAGDAGGTAHAGAEAAASGALAPTSGVDAGPVCDDSLGEPAACPPPGLPTAEGGGCGGFVTTRCNDFKQTMKPRVAQTAVACLNKLNGAERCDPKRIELCGHLALMNACDDGGSAVAAACDGLVLSCGVTAIAPSKTECRLAMSGLREVGREAMLDCAKKHCADKGILGCETASAAKPPPTTQ